MLEWQGHALLGLRAAQGMPSWELDLIRPDMSPETIGKPFMPEIRSVADKLGAYCLILDWIYQPGFDRYCRQENGRWIPHGPAAEDFTGQGALSMTANHILIETLMNAMIAELRAGNWEEAVCRAGVLGHFLQEPFTPGHAMDNMLFEEIFPDPDPTRHIRLHHYFDCASGDFPPPKPRLMGRTVPEAALYLFNEIRSGIAEGKKMVGPVVEAAYRGKDMKDSEAVRKALLCKQSERAAFATVSAWHTAFCIAFDRFDPAETEPLHACDLVGLNPFFWHPSHYTHLLPDCLVCRGRKVPIEVWDKGENGELTGRKFAHGFGMYGHGGAKFYVNGIFSEIRFKLGMPSGYTDGQDCHTRLHFAVETDDRENKLFSEDIEYEAKKRVFEVELGAREPLREVRADIAGAKTLILSSRAIPYTDEKGETRYSVPDLAIIDPVLIP